LNETPSTYKKIQPEELLEHKAREKIHYVNNISRNLKGQWKEDTFM
jgi:hypothetical protein